jgi:hypothetical protein
MQMYTVKNTTRARARVCVCVATSFTVQLPKRYDDLN